MNKETFEGGDLEITQEFVKGSFRTEDLINEEDIPSFLSAVPNNLGKGSSMLGDIKNVDSYEEALSAGIDKAIEMLKGI